MRTGSWASIVAAALAVGAAAPSDAAAGGPRLDPPEDQAETDAVTVERLVDVEATEELLRNGTLARGDDGAPLVVPDGETGTRTKIRFRVTLATPDGGTIEGLFKARQSNYRDWTGEILSYRLGRALGIRLTPTVERRFLRSELEPAITLAGPRFADLLAWEGEGDERFVRGSLTFWVPAFSFSIGEYVATPDGLERLTGWLGHRHRDVAAAQPLLRDLAGVLLLDFLVFNEDRHHNVGTVVPPGGGSLLLVAIDFGDTLYNPSGRSNRCKHRFWRVETLPEVLVESLRALAPETIRSLMVSGDGGPAVDPGIIDAVIDRRERALRRIDELIGSFGEDILY